MWPSAQHYQCIHRQVQVSFMKPLGSYIRHSTEVMRHTKPHTSLFLESGVYIYIYIYRSRVFVVQTDYKRRRNIFGNFVWRRARLWLLTDCTHTCTHITTQTSTFTYNPLRVQNVSIFSRPSSGETYIKQAPKKKHRWIIKYIEILVLQNSRCRKALSRFELVHM